MLFFRVVSQTDRSAKYVSAPALDQNPPLIFCFILTFLKARWLALLSDGISGSARNLKMKSGHMHNPVFAG